VSYMSGELPLRDGGWSDTSRQHHVCCLHLHLSRTWSGCRLSRSIVRCCHWRHIIYRWHQWSLTNFDTVQRDNCSVKPHTSRTWLNCTMALRWHVVYLSSVTKAHQRTSGSTQWRTMKAHFKPLQASPHRRKLWSQTWQTVSSWLQLA